MKKAGGYEMKKMMYQTNERFLRGVLYVLTLVTVSIPVSCNYIMCGGIITEWIYRIQELAGGNIRLFPTAGVFKNTGIWMNALDSNLWYFLPAVLYQMSGNMVFSYRSFMLFIQIGTLLGAILLFNRVFSEENTSSDRRYARCLGVILYLTCPYRIFVCYDRADLSEALVWMLVPLYSWAILGLIRGKRSWREFVIASLTLAGIGYADTVSLVILEGSCCLLLLFVRKILPLCTLAAGTILAFPGLRHLLYYLFFGGLQGDTAGLHTIMGNGYRFGQFFNSYTFRDNHPGMGLGLMFGLLGGLWLWFVMNDKKFLAVERVCTIAAVLSLIASMRYFPWDIIQRLGMPVLRMVLAMNTPAVFAGFGYALLCVPAAGAAGRIARQENRLIADAIPLMILLACIGLCVYQCNMLAYVREPMEL